MRQLSIINLKIKNTVARMFKINSGCTAFVATMTIWVTVVKPQDQVAMEKAVGDDGLGEFVPDLSVLVGLLCYQCTSVDTELLPLCDESLFKSMTSREIKDYIFQCPEDMGAFCIRKLETKQRVVTTTRGCNGPMDDLGNGLRTGCLMYTDNVTAVEICICDTNMCNTAAMPKLNIVHLAVLPCVHFISLL